MSKHPPFKAARSDGQARTVLISCRMVPKGVEAVNTMAEKMAISRAELLRRAIQEFFTNHANDGKKS